MPASSRAPIRIGPSRAASATTFPRKPPKPSPTPSSRSTPPSKGALMPPATTDHAPLTVVLVHGALADPPSGNGVIQRLQAAGIQVTAAPNPLRGIAHDSAYVASFLKQVPGPVP